jgi:hypothetical protein
MRAWVNALRTCGFLIDGARDADLVPRSPGGAGAISRGDHGANTRAGPAAADATAQGSGIVTVGHALDNARATARSAPSHHISSTPPWPQNRSPSRSVRCGSRSKHIVDTTSGSSIPPRTPYARATEHFPALVRLHYKKMMQSAMVQLPERP